VLASVYDIDRRQVLADVTATGQARSMWGTTFRSDHRFARWHGRTGG
jgi:hypothetical protein